MKLATAIILCLVSAARAAAPVAVLNGPSAAPAPGIVILDASGSTGDGKPDWIVTDPDDSVQAMQGLDGRLAVFYMGTKPTTAKIVLVVWGTDADAKSKAYGKRVIAFGSGPAPVPPGPTPVPPTPPTPVPPVPPPAPVLPDGRFKLAAVAYTAGMHVAAPARSKAPQVAAVFGGIASSVAAGTIVDKPTAGLTCKQQLAVAFGTDAAAWQAAKDAIVNEFNRLETVGQIASVKDLGIAFSEIESGLRQVQ